VVPFGRREEKAMDIAGKWRITEMDTWSRDAIDLVGTAYIERRQRE
jgi:hypothetical protein